MEKKDYIRYRLERADQTFKDAILLLESGSIFSALNRFYYAAFYAILALLRLNDNIPKTHKGVKLLFNKNYIKTKIIPKKYSNTYSILFNWRQESDYADHPKIDIDHIEKMIPLIEDLLTYLKNYIKQNTN